MSGACDSLSESSKTRLAMQLRTRVTMCQQAQLQKTSALQRAGSNSGMTPGKLPRSRKVARGQRGHDLICEFVGCPHNTQA